MKFLDWLQCYGGDKSGDNDVKLDDEIEQVEIERNYNSSKRHPRSRHTTTWSTMSIVSAKSTSLYSDSDAISQNFAQTGGSSTERPLCELSILKMTERKEITHAERSVSESNGSLIANKDKEIIKVENVAEEESLKNEDSDESLYNIRQTSNDIMVSNKSAEPLDGNLENDESTSLPQRRSLLTTLKDEFRRACAITVECDRNHIGRCSLDSQWNSIFADLFHMHQVYPPARDSFHPKEQKIGSPKTPNLFQNCHCCRCHPQAYPCMIPWLFPHDLNYCKYCNPCELCMPFQTTSPKKSSKSTKLKC